MRHLTSHLWMTRSEWLGSLVSILWLTLWQHLLCCHFLESLWLLHLGQFLLMREKRRKQKSRRVFRLWIQDSLQTLHLLWSRQGLQLLPWLTCQRMPLLRLLALSITLILRLQQMSNILRERLTATKITLEPISCRSTPIT